MILEWSFDYLAFCIESPHLALIDSIYFIYWQIYAARSRFLLHTRFVHTHKIHRIQLSIYLSEYKYMVILLYMLWARDSQRFGWFEWLTDWLACLPNSYSIETAHTHTQTPQSVFCKAYTVVYIISKPISNWRDCRHAVSLIPVLLRHSNEKVHTCRVYL